MEIQQLRKIYDEKKTIYKQLEVESKYILEDVFSEKELKYDRIESRIKKFDSFEEKIERKDIHDPKKINEITDFLGLRVICLFLPDLLKVKEIIENEFYIVSEDDKLACEEVDKFGYRSIHYIVKLKGDCIGRRYDKIKDYKFEIQVRTLAMHSWANISHHLSYKTEEAIPKELQKDFYALSALFHLADKTFESLFNESLKNKNELLKITDNNKILDMPLNLDTLKRYGELNQNKRRIDPSDDNISKLITELKDINITTIKALDEGIKVSHEEFLLWEKEFLPKNKINANYLGFIRINFSMLSDKYCQKFISSEGMKENIISHRKKIPAKKLKKFEKEYLNCN